MLEEKLKALIECLDRPRSQMTPLALAAKFAEVAALVEQADDVDPSLFALMPAEMRKGGLLLMLGVIAQAAQA